MKRKPAVHPWRHADPGTAQRHLAPLPADRLPPFVYIEAKRPEPGLLITPFAHVRRGMTDAEQIVVDRVRDQLHAMARVGQLASCWIDGGGSRPGRSRAGHTPSRTATVRTAMKRKPAVHPWRHADPGTAQRHLAPLPADRLPPFVYIEAKRPEPGLLITPFAHVRRGMTDAEQIVVDRVRDQLHAMARVGQLASCWIDAASPANVCRMRDAPSPSWRANRLRDFRCFVVVRKDGTIALTPAALPKPPIVTSGTHIIRSEGEKQQRSEAARASWAATKARQAEAAN